MNIYRELLRPQGALAMITGIFRHYLFWLMLFALNRCIFILYNAAEWQPVPWTEVIYSFVSAIPLDLSQASYFTAITFVAALGYTLVHQALLVHAANWINYLLIFLANVIYAAEIPIYDEWHTKLNRKAVLYMQHPTEVINSATNSELAGGIALIALTTWLSIWFYRRYIRLRIAEARPKWYVPAVSILLFPFLLAVGIRGGLQQIPIQQSEAYYSKSNFLNLSAVNTVWNLGQSFVENRYDDGTNPYRCYDETVADSIVAELFHTAKDTFPNVLTTRKPNVVLVLLESWSADMVRSLGGFDSVAPNMDELIQGGIAFPQMYSSGTLSDQGHCSILSGFPSQPGVVILRQPDKFQKLPSILTHFRQNGYYTAYYFGGELIYGNIKGYVYYNQFDRVTEGKDFSSALPKGKLGYHDEFLFGRILLEAPALRQPFFLTAFTMSSHSPYDYPGETKYFDWGGDENMYVNGVHYSDSCIGVFMRNARKQPWFDNTLFVFCSDHSHATPKQRDFFDPASRRVVAFMYGNVIRPEFRGLRVDKMGNHHDIVATLLGQLGGDARPFVWSRNLLNPYARDFGFSADDYMTYFYEPGNAYTYRYTDRFFLHKSFRSPADSARMMRYGSAYTQVLYRQYLNY